MIIRSVRLKNIKSYGTGREGRGVCANFKRGINRISGRNGHGKTSLIEAIGYALFFAKPDYEENFTAKTYLLKHGSREGEIDVTFENLGSAYRVERGLGGRGNRTKVIDLKDESICAEGENEVHIFLCKQLGASSKRQLTEVFTKLVGVKQGYLTRPFDSKGSDATRFFEPLFDVAVFRDCFEKLRPAKDLFRDQLGKVRERKAGIDQRIEDRADSKERLVKIEGLVKQRQEAFEDAVCEKKSSKANKERHERFREILAQAKMNRERARGDLALISNQLLNAKRQFLEAEKAADIAKKSLPDHEIHMSAKREMEVLNERRKARDKCRDERNSAEAKHKEHQSASYNSRSQSGLFSKQRSEKSDEKLKKDREIDQLNQRLSRSKDAFEKAETSFAEASAFCAELQAWVSGLTNMINRIRTISDTINSLNEALSKWNSQSLISATEAAQIATENHRQARTKLDGDRAQQDSLKEQLKQISGGVCPFLKERCRQFDPNKVKMDLSEIKLKIVNDEILVSSSEDEATKAGEKLDSLKKDQAQMEMNRERLSLQINAFHQEMQAILPRRISEIASKLREWNGQIDIFPRSEFAQKNTETNANMIAESISEFAEKARDWWICAGNIFKKEGRKQDEARQERAGYKQVLEEFQRRRKEIEEEEKRLSEQAECKLIEAKKWDLAASESQQKVVECERLLSEFSSLEDDMKRQSGLLNESYEGHVKYLQTKEKADDHKQLRESVRSFEIKHDHEKDKLKIHEQKFIEADKDFVPEELSQAVSDYDVKNKKAIMLEADLTHIKDECEKERRRFQEWEAARKEWEEVSREMRHLDASIGITELARNVLQKAAPKVAQHLCNRIARSAQSLFNQIHPDPIELKWKAKGYSVNVIPNDRRFAMLSGGEQTKLALALTLAMIGEFSNLRFCIFDEPTYAVDAESRQRLADAIIRAKSAANLEQMILVSHDEAFDGKSEHSISVEKSAEGSEIFSMS